MSIWSAEPLVAIRHGSANGDQMGASEMGNSRVAHLLDLRASMRPALGLSTQGV